MTKTCLMTGLAALILLMAASCSKDKDLYDPTAKAKELEKTYQTSFEKNVGKPSPYQDWGFGQSTTAGARAMTRSILTDGDPFTNYGNTDALYKSEAPETAVTYQTYMTLDKWRRADWGGAIDQNAAMNGDAEILLPDGSFDIKFTGGSHDFYVTGNATLNVPDFINQARIYVLPGKTLTLNMNNYINALEIYVANGATLNYNYDKLYYQTGDAKIFNRGTLNLGRDNFEINQRAVVYNEGTLRGKNITSKPGDGNPSFLYNYGEVSLTGNFQLNSCANFFNEGTMTVAGETELTQGNSLIWYINKGTYTTGIFKSFAWNGTMYNYCRLFVTGDAMMQNGVFHLMNGSYIEMDRGVFNNFKFLMRNNAGFNAKSGTLWGRDGADYRGKYTIQGFQAIDDDAKAFVRLDGVNKIPAHKGSAFHIQGKKLTLAYNNITFYHELYYFGTTWNDCVNNFANETTEAALRAEQNENTTWNTHDVPSTNLVTGSDFAATGFTLKDGECAATWKGESEVVDTNPVVEEGRIMCEDLGTIGDFDFNDVVFDAKIHQDGTTEITLLAAGGTLHLTVAGEEVHAKFGVGLREMVNTGIVSKPAVTFTAADKYEHLIDIPIRVRQQNGENITYYELTAIKGKAPQKICVPVGTKWADEYVSITLAYPGFKDWATGETGINWSWIENVVDRLTDQDLSNND